jgi:hypothetical protein
VVAAEGGGGILGTDGVEVKKGGLAGANQSLQRSLETPTATDNQSFPNEAGEDRHEAGHHQNRVPNIGEAVQNHLGRPAELRIDPHICVS